MDPTPGVTRDRLEAPVTWRGRTFHLVDTGGVTFEHGSTLAEALQRQVAAAIEEADLLLWVCEAGRGPAPLDTRIAALLRRTGKPVLLVANKADTPVLADQAVELHTLGVGTPAPISSTHGRGIGDLLDLIVERLPLEDAVPRPSDQRLPAPGAAAAETTDLTFAIVGRPNVGKSSLLNRLVGRERATVDIVPGTTRDAVAVSLVHGDRRYQLVDTAGVRPRPKLKTMVDRASVGRSFRAIAAADGCLLLVDASVGLLADDLTLLGLILKAGRPCVVLLNKWDLLPRGSPKAAIEAFRRRVPFAAFLPVIPTSARTGYQVEKALALAAEAAARGRRPIPVPVLRTIVQRLREATGRPGRLRVVRIKAVHHVCQRPVTLKLSVYNEIRWRRSDLAFVERVIRSAADLEGVPIRVEIRKV